MTEADKLPAKSLGSKCKAINFTDSITTFQVCETLYKEYDAVEDHPECETVEKTECDTSRYERGHCTL